MGAAGRKAMFVGYTVVNNTNLDHRNLAKLYEGTKRKGSSHLILDEEILWQDRVLLTTNLYKH